MNDARARFEYEQWCSENRKRKSDAGWQLWFSAYYLGASSIAPGLDQLPEEKQRFALEMIANVIRTLSE